MLNGTQYVVATAFVLLMLTFLSGLTPKQLILTGDSRGLNAGLETNGGHENGCHGTRRAAA
jgi:hypothetical protein